MNRLTIVIALAAVGCASGDAGGGDTTSGNTRTGSQFMPSIGAMAGTGAMQAPVDPGMFGNAPGSAQMAMKTMEDPPNKLPNGCIEGEVCITGPDDCGSLTLEADVETIMHPGNVLLVFDTSFSMTEQWNGKTRWETAGPAITSALMPLQDQLTIGTIFFPRSDPNAPLQCIDPTGITCAFVPGLMVPAGSCGVTPVTSADQINFAPGPQFLTTFTTNNMGAMPYAPVPGGLTPLKEGLQQAQAAIAAAQLEGITSVVVITDGDPNCEWDQAVATQIVTDWAAAGINTYVIGLPGGVSQAGDTVLNQLASAGGTGEYITPDNAAALEMKLREIATETVKSGFDSCDITINPAAEAPEKLHLVVTEGGVDQSVARDLADDYKWNISADGSKVTLEGRLCEDAMTGRFEALNFQFGCVDLPPLPPPPIVM